MSAMPLGWCEGRGMVKEGGKRQERGVEQREKILFPIRISGAE